MTDMKGAEAQSTHLSPQGFVHLDILARATEGLLEEGEEDRDDDDSLEGLSKDDEKDWDGENIYGHSACSFLARTGFGPGLQRPGGTGSPFMDCIAWS